MTPKLVALLIGTAAGAAISVVGMVRSGGPHATPAPAPAQSTISAPGVTSADFAGLRAALEQANLAAIQTSLEKRIDASEERQTRAIAQLRTDLRAEIRDSRRAADARANVIANQVQHFEQRFDEAARAAKEEQ